MAQQEPGREPRTARGSPHWYLSRSLAGRDATLDVFRGLAIAGMILVNNSGPGRPAYGPLVHSPWHGWTIADLVFPAFIFIAGVSIPLSLSRAAAPPARRHQHARILRRAALLFAVGLLLVGFPSYDLRHWPVTGVLQRIAVCYLIASLLFLHTAWRTQALIAALLCVGYWLLLAQVPVPGTVNANFSPRGNLARFIDGLVLGPHTNADAEGVDPDGLLGTIPAVATALIGVLAGHWLRAGRPLLLKIGGLLSAGLALTLLGLVWDAVLPINKPLWTSSFVVFAAGASMLMLALLYIVIDVCGLTLWSKPFEIFGVNAVVLYAFAYLLQRMLYLVRIDAGDGTRVRLRFLLFERVIDPLAAGELGTLLYGILFLLVCLLMLAVLYRNRIFIRL